MAFFLILKDQQLDVHILMVSVVFPSVKRRLQSRERPENFCLQENRKETKRQFRVVRKNSNEFEKPKFRDEI